MSMAGVGAVLPEVWDAGLVSSGVGSNFQILILFSKRTTLLIRSVPLKILFAS